MNKKEFTRKDGTIGYEYKLEEGDVFNTKYNQAKENEAGKYTNYWLGIEFNGEEIYVRLTATQAKMVNEIEDVTQKPLIAYKYTTDKGDFVGIKVDKTAK